VIAKMPAYNNAECFYIPTMIEIRGWGRVKCVAKVGGVVKNA